MKRGQNIGKLATTAENDIRFIVNANEYEVNKDKRLLIPFIEGQKIGFINQQGEVVVEATYDLYLGDIYSSKDIITVMKNFPCYELYGNGKVNPQIKKRFGVIDAEGNEIIPTEYDSIAVSDTQELITLRKDGDLFAVINRNGDIVVPYGKYNEINGFTHGYARVKIGTVSNGVKNNGNKWGIINEHGEVVVPVEYDDIWKFYRKKYRTAILKKNGKSYRFHFDTGQIYSAPIPPFNEADYENVDLNYDA